MLAASPAWGFTIGGFDASRLGCASCALETGDFYEGLRTEIADRGHDIATLTTLTVQSLSTVDVFYTSLLDEAFELSPSEEAALESWLQIGGTLLSAGDLRLASGDPNPAYNELLNPFGINQSGAASPRIGTANVVDLANEITNGLNGPVMEFDYATAALFDADASALTLAQDSTGAIIAIRKEIAAGRIVAFGDFNMFTDAFRMEPEERLFFNTVDSATEIPEPASALLIGLGLVALALGRPRA